MKAYAIRRRGTLEYLPALASDRGFSHSEPVEGGGPLGPRLHFFRRSVDNALTAWLRGRFITSRGKGSSYFDEEPWEETSVEPQPHRRRDDMEVVEFELVEVPRG